MSEVQEYPKALYKGEEFKIVPDKTAESSARKDGFKGYHEQEAEQAGGQTQVRGSRKPPDKQEQAGGQTAGAGEQQQSGQSE